MVHATADMEAGPRAAKPPPAKIWQASEPPFKGIQPADPSGWRKSDAETAIIIDNGSWNVRAGWSFDSAPRYSIPPLWARYKDRKINRYYTFVGSDIYADGTSRGQAKSVYDPGSDIVNNWDAMEGVLDYLFIKLGADAATNGISRPVVMTETVANLPYTRKSMYRQSVLLILSS